jgi:hypothetical protein
MADKEVVFVVEDEFLVRESTENLKTQASE